jgi:hypothetical protein
LGGVFVWYLVTAELTNTEIEKHGGRGGFDGSAAAKFDALIAATALAVGASVAHATWADSSVAG